MHRLNGGLGKTKFRRELAHLWTALKASTTALRITSRRRQTGLDHVHKSKRSTVNEGIHGNEKERLRSTNLQGLRENTCNGINDVVKAAEYVLIEVQMIVSM